MPGPAYRVHTPRLLLRCWEPADAAALVASMAASVDHLRPWLPWAAGEPESVDAKVERLRQFRGNFDLGRDYVYGIFAADGGGVIGGTGLHPRVGAGAREIGYWIDARQVGRGYATEAAAALVRVAFEVDGVDRVEIRCDPHNAPSLAIPRRLGFAYEATLRRRTQDHAGEPRDTMVWSLFRDGFAASPAAAAEVEAYDAAGGRLL